MKIAYMRVSTEEQNEARQREALKNVEIERWFMDKLSGKNTDRPQFQTMLSFVREGDELYVSELSRLSRSLKDLLETLEYLDKKKVKLISSKEGIDTSTATGRCLIQLIGVFNEFERAIIHERTMAGIEAAKAAGKYKGRKRNKYDTELLGEVLKGLADKTMTVTKAAELLNVTRPTIYKLLQEGANDEMEEKNDRQL